MNLTLAIKEMFEGNEVEIYQLEDGSPVMTVDGLAKSLGYADRNGVQKIMDRNEYLKDIEFSTEDKLSLVEGSRKVTREVRIFTEDGIYEVTMLSHKPKAKEFRAFVRKILKSLRKGEAILVQPQFDSTKEKFEMQLIGARYTSEILRLDTTSNVRMLETVHEQHGVPTNHLPVYVDEEVTKSLSELLREHSVGVGPAKANTKLIELGLLEIKERPSSKGSLKEFKSLTEKGLQFGKNLISPRNLKETQPHYYPSKFDQLKVLLQGEV